MDDHLLIEYIEGRLSSEKEAEVRHEIENNPVVEANYRTLRLCYDAIYFSQTEDIKKNMSNWSTDQGQIEFPIIKFWRKNRLRFAAAAGLVILVTCLLILRQPAPQERLFANYYYSMAPDVTRSINDPTFTTEYLKMLDAYEDGDDTIAIERARTIEEANKNFMASRFLLTDIYVQHEQFDEAKSVIDDMRTRATNSFKEQCQWDWLHVLILFRTGQIDQGASFLKKIQQDEDHIFHIKANELASDLSL